MNNSTVEQQPIYSNTSSSSQAISTNNNVVNLNRSSDNNCTAYPTFGINNTINAAAPTTNNIGNSNGGCNQQWSVWQQFPWPSPQTAATTTQQLIATEHNENPNHHQQQYQQSNRWSKFIGPRRQSVCSHCS